MTMKKLLPSLLLALALLVPSSPSMAQEVRESNMDNDVLSQMQSEGWRIVKNGVLQRELRAGEVETFVFGSAGFTWKLQELRGMVQKYQKAFKAHPSSELRKMIAGLRKEMANTQKMIQQARAEEAVGESGIEKVSCSIDFTYNAAAGSGASVQGTNADASATFTGNCGFTGDVYATAYAQVTVGGAPTNKSMVDGPRSGASVTASASATLNGGAPCESNSYASVTSPKFTSSYSKTATNSVCPVPEVQPTISLSVSPTSTLAGPLNLYNDDCVAITWTATSSTGTATFYRNNVSLGSRTSYAETVCNLDTNTMQQIDVYATATNTAGTATSATKSAFIQHHVPTTTPPTITLSMSPASSSTAPIHLYESDCVTITWTATSSTGTAIFYRNGVSKGSRTSYSELVCNQEINTSQQIAVYATATNTAGTTTSATKTAYIQHHRVFTEPACDPICP